MSYKWIGVIPDSHEDDYVRRSLGNQLTEELNLESGEIPDPGLMRDKIKNSADKA